MHRAGLRHIPCSIARTAHVVGEWWTPLILRDLFAGLSRFEDLRRDLGLASNVLADRLATLVEHGIVERRAYQDAPTRYEYVLTAKGRDLFPILMTLIGWGDRWEAGEAGPPTVLVHDACGRSTTPTLVCEHCGGELRDDTVTSVAGPGGRTGPGTALIGPLLAERRARLTTARRQKTRRPATRRRRG
jgi:DNA-binding HxlR family transcriptional regulator